MERIERTTTTAATSTGASTATAGTAMQQQGATTTTTTSGGGLVGSGYNESHRELEQLRARGLYRGHGEDLADRRVEQRVDQYVKEDAPVVEEQIRRREIREVIPQVQREREVTEIRHAVLPIHDRVHEQRTVSERELAGIEEREYRARLHEAELRKNRAIRDKLSRGYRQELEADVEYRYAKPTVEETIKPRVIHEIHPVIQREIEKEHLEREYLPIRERVIEGPRVAEDVEVLRPLTREEWERSHGRALYEQSGWKYGAPADEYVTREYSRFEIDDRVGGANVPPLPPRRTVTPTSTRYATPVSREYYDERSGGAYDMGGMARALEPEFSGDRRGRYDSGYAPSSAGYASGGGYTSGGAGYASRVEPERHHHGLFSGLGRSHKSSRSSRRHYF